MVLGTRICVVRWNIPQKHSLQMLRQVLPQEDLCRSLTRLCFHPGAFQLPRVIVYNVQEMIRQLLFYESLLLVMQADYRLAKAVLLLQRFP